MERRAHQTHVTPAAFVPYAPDSAPSQRFRIEQWIPHLAAADIEVVWAPGKCALTAPRSVAREVPTVASPVGASRDVILDGRNGLLAASGEEWLAHVAALAQSPDLRARLGREGRRTVEEGYSARRSAAALADVVRTVVERRSGR